MLVAALAAVFLSACGSNAPQATQVLAVDPAVNMADTSFVDAAHKGDAATLGNLLDANFQWISASGKIFNRADTLKTLPKPALADESPAGLNCNSDPNGSCGITQFTYANVVHTVAVSSGKTQELRVWVKHPEGWRALVYQEVVLPAAAPAAAAGAAANCDNPCKNIPFTPQDDQQKGVADAYKNLQTAAAAFDAPVWNDLITYEFVEASSNMAQPLSKNMGLDQLHQKNLTGLVPIPVATATMYEFPGVVVMRTKLQPAHGNPLEATDVWILRNDLWVMTLTYETAVGPA